MTTKIRYFVDGIEVTCDEALEVEAAGTHKVAVGGSGVVPEPLRKAGETEQDYLCPWMELRSTLTKEEAIT